MNKRREAYIRIYDHYTYPNKVMLTTVYRFFVPRVGDIITYQKIEWLVTKVDWQFDQRTYTDYPEVDIYVQKNLPLAED